MHVHALARFGVCFSRREADPGTVRKRDKSALKTGGIIVNIVKKSFTFGVRLCDLF